MVLINYAGREINAKIVYYGPGLSGKTTNLECIYASVPQQSRGKMVSMKTRQDRTLFFDFLPLELGEVHGFRTRFLLYTVPGQVFYNATRKLVLKGADAVVFVADSALGKMDENRESLRNLDENLREQGLALDSVPFVLQYNKRDLPQVFSIDDLNAALNPHGVPAYEAAAASGQGVYETLHAVSRLLFERLMNDLRPQSGRGAAPAVAPVAPGGAAAAAAAGARPRSPVPDRSVAVQAPVIPRVAAPSPVAPQVAAMAARGSAPGRDPRRIGSAAPGPAPERIPTVFGTPSAGHLPAMAGPSEILDSVQASASSLESPDPTGDYASYGHVVDLGAAPDAEAPTPFIKDPMRRSESIPGRPSRVVAAPSPSRSQQVTVSIPRGELKPGGTIRIVLDIKVEP